MERYQNAEKRRISPGLVQDDGFRPPRIIPSPAGEAFTDVEVQWLTYLDCYLTRHHLQHFTDVLRKEDKLTYAATKDTLLSSAVQDCAEKMFWTRIPFTTSGPS